MMTQTAGSPQPSTSPAREPVERSPLWSVLATIAAAGAFTYGVGVYGTQVGMNQLFATATGTPPGTVIEVVHDQYGDLHARPCPDASWVYRDKKRSDLATTLDSCSLIPVGDGSVGNSSAKRAVVLSLDWSSVPTNEDPEALARSYLAEAEALQRENPSLLVVTATIPSSTPPWESLDASTPPPFGGRAPASPESDESAAARYAFNEEVRACCDEKDVLLDLDAIESTKQPAALDAVSVSGARTLLLQQRLNEILSEAKQAP